jgi:signal transduction histidine kinase
MLMIEALNSIRSPWLSRVSHRLARGQGLRELFISQLGAFFDLIVQAVDTGDPAWVNPLLREWAQARTFTELEERESSLSPILQQMLIMTFEIARETMDAADALDLMDALLPVYTHAFDFVAQRETEYRLLHMQNELDKVRSSLERLDKNKSDFISIAAHELKTPLTLIEGYTSMLEDGISKLSGGDRFALLLEGIHSGSHRLREIIDDMIDVSMIDNELLSLNFQPVWLSQIFDAIQRDAADILHSRGQTLTIQPFPGIHEMTYADLDRLYQVLRNLVSNAIKYTPDGGQIEVDGRMLPGFIEIVVADHGIGIDPENHERIFDKFGSLGSPTYHSSGKTKFKGGGPGLGLPIARGIIQAHGGTIWVESEGYDEQRMPGTKFHVMLPLLKDPPDDKSAKLFRSMSSVDFSDQNN